VVEFGNWEVSGGGGRGEMTRQNFAKIGEKGVKEGIYQTQSDWETRGFKIETLVLNRKRQMQTK